MTTTRTVSGVSFARGDAGVFRERASRAVGGGAAESSEVPTAGSSGAGSPSLNATNSPVAAAPSAPRALGRRPKPLEP